MTRPLISSSDSLLDANEAEVGDDPRLRMRTDARRNRALVLEAAREVFASDGPGVPLDEIARRAGVGAGTVYRHFPNKAALLKAVIAGRLESLTDEAHALSSTTDSGQAFFDFAARLVKEGTIKHDLVDALTTMGIDAGISGSPVAQRFRDALGELMRRAQQVGAVRLDVGPDDVIAVLTGASLAIRRRTSDTSVTDHVLAIICDGLRRDAGSTASGH